MPRPSSRRRLNSTRRFAAQAAVAALALGLAGCSGDGSRAFSAKGPGGGEKTSRTIDPAYTVAPEEETKTPANDAPNFDLFKRRAAELAMREGKTEAAVGHLSKLYEQNPGDRQVAYDYARHLRYLGATTLAGKVLNDGLAAHPQDKLLRLEKGKLLLGDGRPSEAIAVLSQLSEELPDDPAVLQALGVAHDRRGEHDKAQTHYAKAMKIGRPSAALLNNAGLSHVLSGDLPKAVSLLREATTAPGANAQVRQNLALALTLAGQGDEARRFAGEGAPPAISKATIGAFQKIKTIEHPWSRAATGG